MTKCEDPSQSALEAELLLIIILIDHAPTYFIKDHRSQIFLRVGSNSLICAIFNNLGASKVDNMLFMF